MPIENDQGELLIAYLDFYPHLMDPTMDCIMLTKKPSGPPTDGSVRIRVAIPIPKEAFHASYAVTAESKVDPNVGEQREPGKNILA